jgi:hypothetical protein
MVVNGILWKFGAGSPWRDLPERVRALADLLRPLGPLEARRHLGDLAHTQAKSDTVGAIE